MILMNPKKKYTVKEKIDWINKKIQRIHTDSWTAWALADVKHLGWPVPNRYGKIMWPIGFYETQFNDIIEGLSLYIIVWLLNI